MRILIAVDVTHNDAEDFVREAVRFTRGMGGVIDLIFVDEAADENPWIRDDQLRTMMSTHYEAWHQGLQDRLAHLLAEAVPAGARGAAHVVRGQAAPVLLERSADYDVLIVGNRPATGLARLAHGVVAERVMRQSDKPVLVLPRV